MIRNIATVLNGNVIAQVIALAALPVMAQVYTDKAFGAFQLYLSIIVVLMPFAALRLEFVLLNLTGTPRNLAHVLAMCLVINLVGAGVVLLFLLVWPVGWIWPDVPLLPFPVWLIAVGFLAFGALQTFNSLAVRNKAFRLIARARIVQSLSFNLGAIAAGLAFVGVVPILLCDVGSRLATSVLIYRKSGAARLGRLDRADLIWMRDIFVQYRHYPLFSVPSGVLSGVSMGLPVMALFALFEIGEVGQFAMAWRVTLLPIGVFAFSISQVVNGRIAEIQRESSGPIRPHIVRIAAFLILIGLAVGASVYVLSEPAMALVLGEDWQLAGKLIALLVPIVVASIAVAPLNTALTLLGHQFAQVVWDIARLGTLIVVFVWAARSDANLFVTTKVYSWAAASFSALYLIVLLVLCDRHNDDNRQQPSGVT